MTTVFPRVNDRCDVNRRQARGEPWHRQPRDRTCTECPKNVALGWEARFGVQAARGKLLGRELASKSSNPPLQVLRPLLGLVIATPQGRSLLERPGQPKWLTVDAGRYIRRC